MFVRLYFLSVLTAKMPSAYQRHVHRVAATSLFLSGWKITAVTKSAVHWIKIFFLRQQLGALYQHNLYLTDYRAPINMHGLDFLYYDKLHVYYFLIFFSYRFVLQFIFRILMRFILCERLLDINGGFRIILSPRHPSSYPSPTSRRGQICNFHWKPRHLLGRRTTRIPNAWS